MVKSSSSSKNEVFDDSFCSTSCKKNTKSLNTKITELSEKLSDSKTMLYHYKLGLSQVEARLVEFKHQEIKLCEKIRRLEFNVECKNNRIERLTNELEELKKEKKGLESKLTVLLPPPAQVYSFSKKDMSWTGLHEFADDTITDYSRPSPSIESNSNDLQNSNSSIFEHGESSESIMSKPMIKFVKAHDYADVKTNKVKAPRKPFVKYAEIRSSVNRPNMNVAQPKRTSFAKPSHSCVRRPFHGRSAVRTQSQVPRVPTVTKRFPTVDSKFFTIKSTFSAYWGNKRKVVKASACWIWRHIQNTTEKCSNCNSVSVIFKKYQYIDTQGRLKSVMALVPKKV
nr:hypothetical protein [Tanacetum cinerariifolium]